MTLEIDVMTSDHIKDTIEAQDSEVCHTVCKPQLILRPGDDEELVDGLLNITLDYGFCQIIIKMTISSSGE